MLTLNYTTRSKSQIGRNLIDTSFNELNNSSMVLQLMIVLEKIEKQNEQ